MKEHDEVSTGRNSCGNHSSVCECENVRDHRCLGYDGSEYGIGDRVELSPHTDLWARGARFGVFGVVVGLSTTPDDRVTVNLGYFEGRRVKGPEDAFRNIERNTDAARRFGKE